MEIVLEFALFIITGIVVFGGLAILGIYVAVRCNSESNQLINGFPKCKCNDVNQCDVWCIAKQRFNEDPPID